MPNNQFHTAISAPRFNRYLAACGNHQQRAEELYRANLRLSEKMYSIIGMFEVILRNSIDRHFIAIKGGTWLEDAVMDGGYLDVSPGCEDSYHSVQDVMQNLELEYTHDRLIAKLTFGFWRYQFSKKEFAASGSTLLQIFPNLPPGTRQKAVFQDLFRINDIRNRIAHYEPICFDKPTGAISTVLVQKRYYLILEILKWLGCPAQQVLHGIDGVKQAINEVDNI